MKTVVGCLVVLGCLGCGMSHEARPPAEGPTQPGAVAASGQTTGFDFRILRAGKSDPNLPDPAVSLDSERTEDPELVSGDHYSFEHIRLSDDQDPRAQFLVWPESGLGPQIRDGFIEHRDEDETGKPTGAPTRHPAHFDPATHRWYLPLGEITLPNPQDEYPGRGHQLTVNLSLADGTSRIFYVRLQMSGPVPKFGILEVDAPEAFPDITSEAHALAAGARAVHALRITNPSPRPLTLWIDHGTLQPTRLEMCIAEQTYSQDAAKPPYWDWPRSGPAPLPLQCQVSVAELKISTLQVVRSDGSSENVALRQRASIALQAKETVILEWFAAPVSGQRSCSLPALTYEHFLWRSDRFHESDVPKTWSIAGYRMEGAFSAALTVSSPEEPAPANVEKVLRVVARANGLSAAGAAAAPCTGVY